MLIIKRKYTTFDRHTNRYIGTAMPISLALAKVIEDYKSTKRKLARRSYTK